MHIAVAILVFQCTLSSSIKVPVTWDNDSEVKPVNQDKNNEYFHYSANKPHFAVEVAHFHNVKSPENHYESYPINPHTGLNKPQFGKHQMLNSEHKNYKPYQEYVKQDYGQVKPITNYYEVYHPYEAEVPALQTIYKDPILNKIRNDVADAKNRLQKYEHDAGESDVHKDEYLERPDSIDKKKVPHKNIPVQYEIHRPVRRPIYYQRVPIHSNREHILNQKLRHPWSQSYAKVTPMHYHPLKHNLHQLRQQHSLTYDDSNNEYPQILPLEQYAEKPEGYDIFEKGKENYKNIRNGFEESINNAVLKNRPKVMDNLELQKDDHSTFTQETESENEEFIPIKNYAQVRKTATFRHLPKSAAYEDADNLEEIQNAPRLREAIKSSKNQVVYSEEGYEDSAYDHAGEQKHASDHEGHGGFLTESEASKGKYKIPTVDTGFTDEGKTSSRDQILHGEKWNDEHAEDFDGNASEDYSEDENDYSESNDAIEPDNDSTSERNKRDSNNTNSVNENIPDHDLSKREVNLNSSSIKEKIKNKNTTLSRHNVEISTNKYPYYFNNLKTLDKNSPLRYSENLNLIPNKTKDNSAFYNSRLNLKCPEVEKEVNPIPDKFDSDEISQDNKGEEYNNDKKGEEEFKKFKNKQRLEGLGDKIDCFKKKYFGQEPLDSPFFTENFIKNPQPLEEINSSIFSVDKLKNNVSNQQINKEKIGLSNSLYKGNNTFTDITKNQSNSIDTKNNTILTKLRKKRGVTFMYEPYKVIKDSQATDSKKFPASSNISPVIRKLQTRQIADTSNNQKYYKDIGKNDRPLNERDFIDVSKDQRRGEPRYEIDLKNHRPHYSPVENKTSMSIEDYREKTANKNEKTKKNFVHLSDGPQSMTYKYIPRTVTTQSIAASNIISKTIQSTTIKPQTKDEEDLDADYEEYEDESDEITSTTTSTTKPKLFKRIHLAPTAKPKEDAKSNSMKLQLTTRFHTSTTDAAPIHIDPPEHSEKLIRTPNYREKKKKTTKSTLVTDTESYGDDTDDMRREEIDAMIGIKQDMDEYTPTYEKENEHSDSTKKHKNTYEKVIDDQLRENDESQEEDDEDDDSSEEDEYDDGEDDEDDFDVIDNNQENKNQKLKETTPLPDRRGKIQLTTSEPTKRTLIQTTEPTSTTEVLYGDLQPTVYRKKVEIHKELPVNKTSPHVTHYKQDIKEIEIIKEVDRPHNIPNNNHPVSLNLYKDETLAREINNLGDIDVFNDNIDFENGPKHGGNYRNVNPESDVETSQSESKKIIEHETLTIKPRNQNYRNTELKRLEKSDIPKSSSTQRNVNHRRKMNRFSDEKSAKLIELQDDDNNGDNIENYNVYNGNSKAYSRNNNEPMHGGNYRSAKITLHKNSQDTTTESSTTNRIAKQKRNRKTEAEVLNAYARAATEITTMPAFILDPSKRMYYYLED
ncbi:MATH and LRR domain-containing protein PFE0570w-like [Pieris rapae]|uniref:MATH and LRR domain-containing protein PFE0570w-like n=1 Tax=Pieris rapae TaxID=64459 RepID=UPI001E27EA84|nr:MATH and LRR domain-containing protein PFE0570w-like [Pieris rapae]